MVTGSVSVRAKTNEDAIDSAVSTALGQAPLSGATSIDDVEITREGEHYSVITFFYTA